MPDKKPVDPNRGKHLTEADRMAIQVGIQTGSRISAIAREIHKDPTTVSKEIHLRRIKTKPCTYGIDCINYRRCTERKKNPMVCCKRCPSYVPFCCSRRDRSPGACNGCSRINACHYDKYQYRAAEAHSQYRETLVSCREGLNLTEEEGKKLSAVIAPLILKGQSPYMILINHPDLGISEGTIYNYISAGLMAEYGVTDSSLPMKVKRKPIKKKDKAKFKKKKDRSYLIGRTNADYLIFTAREENRYLWELQLDTVYNSVSDGPFMETMMFVPCTFLMAFYQEERTDEAMVNGIDQLDNLLGPELFAETASLIKTDRGTEFVMADRFETRPDGTRRAHIFYCDAMASCQKPNVECSHLMLRRDVPKNTNKKKSMGISYADLKALGLVSQEAMNHVISNINSVPRKSLDGKTPIQVMKFKKPALWEKLQSFGIREIPGDDVILNKDVLKSFRTGIEESDLEPEKPGIVVNTVRPKFHRKRKVTGGNENEHVD